MILLETIPTPVRDARLRYNGATFAITNTTQKVVAATHLRGQIAETQCNNCQTIWRLRYSGRLRRPHQGVLHELSVDAIHHKRTCKKQAMHLCHRFVRLKRTCLVVQQLTRSLLGRPHQSRAMKSRPHFVPLTSTFSSNDDATLVLLEAVQSTDCGSLPKMQEGYARILGDLFLPLLNAASPDIQKLVPGLLPDLNTFHERDMSNKPVPLNVGHN